MIESLFLLHADAGGQVQRLQDQCQGRSIPTLTNLTRALLARGTVLVAGGQSLPQIVDVLQSLRRNGVKTIFALDTAQLDDDEKLGLADWLEKERFHFKQTEAILYLLQTDSHFEYAYPKADVSASVVVVMPKRQCVLLVRRAFAPFKGMFCLPSGFLRPLIEDLPGCASRELKEETGVCVRPDSLVPLAVRSSPGRDTRGHVIEHSFLAVLTSAEEDTAVAAIQVADDADEAVLLSFDQALRLPLAADHSATLEHGLTLFAKRRTLWQRIADKVRGLHSTKTLFSHTGVPLRS